MILNFVNGLSVCVIFVETFVGMEKLFLLFILLGFATIAIRRGVKKSSLNISKWFSISFIVTHFFLIGIVFTSFVLSEKGIYFRGYQSHRIIFALTCFVGILSYWLDVFNLNSIFKPFMIFLVFIEGFLILPCSVDIFWSYHSQLYYDSSELRIEDTRHFIAPAQMPDLFVKNGLFEKRYSFCEKFQYHFRNDELKSLKVFKKQGDTVIVEFNCKTTGEYLKPDKNPLICKIKIE